MTWGLQASWTKPPTSRLGAARQLAIAALLCACVGAYCEVLYVGSDGVHTTLQSALDHVENNTPNDDEWLIRLQKGSHSPTEESISGACSPHGFCGTVEYDNERSRRWLIDGRWSTYADVTIEGGYDDKDDEVPDLDPTLTVFEGLVNVAPLTDVPVYNLFHIRGSGDGSEVVTFRNVQFQNAHADRNYSCSDGAGGCNSDSLNNFPRRGGAALEVRGADVALDGCRFADNTAWGSGGAIVVYNGSLTDVGSLFENNRAGWLNMTPSSGGAISVEVGSNHSLDLSGTTFTCNGAQTGGALRISTPTATPPSSPGHAWIRDSCEFRQNYTYPEEPGTAVGTFGGAIHIYESGGAIEVTWPYRPRDLVVEVDDALFIDNSSISNGGAIWVETYIQGDVMEPDFVLRRCPNVTATLRDCEFSGNIQQRADGIGGGGAIGARLAEVRVLDCAFTNNTSFGDHCVYGGGAIYGYSHADLIILRSTFLGNSARHGGGAMYVRNNSVASVEQCVFVDNHGQMGGGAICVNGNGAAPAVADLVDCIFSDNSTGDPDLNGVLECDGGDNIFGNGKGGALYAHKSGYINAVNCVFTGNVSVEQGGAVCNGLTWEGNCQSCQVGETEGEVPDCCPPEMNLINCLFAGNVAEGGTDNGNACPDEDEETASDGGAVFNRETAITNIVNCTIVENHAERDVGGVGNLDCDSMTPKATVRLYNSIIWNNTDRATSTNDDFDLHMGTGGTEGPNSHNLTSAPALAQPSPYDETSGHVFAVSFDADQLVTRLTVKNAFSPYAGQDFSGWTFAPDNGTKKQYWVKSNTNSTISVYGRLGTEDGVPGTLTYRVYHMHLDPIGPSGGGRDGGSDSLLEGWAGDFIDYNEDGYKSSVQAFPCDLDGNARQNGTVDIGAFEAGGGTVWGSVDCDGDGIADRITILREPWRDCDPNGVLDECEVAVGICPCDPSAGPCDCDGNWMMPTGPECECAYCYLAVRLQMYPGADVPPLSCSEPHVQQCPDGRSHRCPTIFDLDQWPHGNTFVP